MKYRFLVVPVILSLVVFSFVAQAQTKEDDYQVIDRVSEIPLDYSSSSKAWVFTSIDSAFIEKSFESDQRIQKLEDRIAALEQIIYKMR